jgi:hypothetical protein
MVVKEGNTLGDPALGDPALGDAAFEDTASEDRAALRTHALARAVTVPRSKVRRASCRALIDS